MAVHGAVDGSPVYSRTVTARRGFGRFGSLAVSYSSVGFQSLSTLFPPTGWLKLVLGWIRSNGRNKRALSGEAYSGINRSDAENLDECP